MRYGLVGVTHVYRASIVQNVRSTSNEYLPAHSTASSSSASPSPSSSVSSSLSIHLLSRRAIPPFPLSQLSPSYLFHLLSPSTTEHLSASLIDLSLTFPLA